MYESQQHLVDLQENGGFGSDPNSWLSGADDRSSLSRTFSSLSTAAASAAATGDVDRVLFNDLVEMVPLVQSLIDRKANPSFTRRGSMICTKMPSRESLYKKAITTKKQRDQNKNVANNPDGCADDFSIFSSSSVFSEKDRKDLASLREQVEDLQRKLSEKDELLKSVELSKKEMASIHAELDNLKNEDAEKDFLIKSSQLQLSDTKTKLADKQAAVEKLQWEAAASNKKVEKLQEDLEMVQGDLSSMMLLIQGLTKSDALSAEDYEDVSYPLDEFDIDDLNEIEMQEMEAAREAYVAAVTAAKVEQDEGSFAAVTSARLRLQSLVIKQKI
ncbi:protein MICROTUBULE BINDING PROTEIN 2C-like [Olea europaea var. sylvestris]|uniref:protein MICROTUBULE BINDING PROTEIN 2C-like n=1 Tax=Olea europaea var. sylvestris TaxID=158386 RepID=UPI000C1CF1E5|nr:protein MICROTUBULE BINDING PROTEIN 2C-like [Olea europaea var. sylvestris]